MNVFRVYFNNIFLKIFYKKLIICSFFIKKISKIIYYAAYICKIYIKPIYIYIYKIFYGRVNLSSQIPLFFFLFLDGVINTG